MAQRGLGSCLAFSFAPLVLKLTLTFVAAAGGLIAQNSVGHTPDRSLTGAHSHLFCAFHEQFARKPVINQGIGQGYVICKKQLPAGNPSRRPRAPRVYKRYQFSSSTGPQFC
jgi:hypothetical protein